MLRIRLSRVGKKHSPHFRVVVADQRAPIQGKFVEIIGHYHPAQTSKDFVVKEDKVKAWIAKGAVPTDTVWNLLCDHGIMPKDQKRMVTHARQTSETETEQPATLAVETEESTTEKSAPEEEAEKESASAEPPKPSSEPEPAVEAEPPSEQSTDDKAESVESAADAESEK